MMRRIRILLLATVLLNAKMGILHAQAPSITGVTANNTSIPRFDRFELTVQFTGAYNNPFDYDEILVRAVFTAPSGRKDTTEGFYMSGYTLNTNTGNLTPSGTNTFKIRYAPAETGNYTYVVTVRNSAGTATSASQTFQGTASSRKGFVRRNPSNYLSFDNGDQYVMIGQNLSWQQSNKYLDFKNWTDKLAANQANFIRLWQCHWGLGIEWTGSPYNGLKSYSQVNSFYTDKLLEECEAKGIYVMLCINHHGMVSTTVNPDWGTSPYNVVNGGPCANTSEFFTHPTAKQLHKNRLRYIVARWGYSRNIMSWELFNEVDWTDDFSKTDGVVKRAVRDWHIEMAAYLKSIDPYKHLVTTSYYNPAEDIDVWKSKDIDFTQTHFYNGSANFETVLADGVRTDLVQVGKPSYTGEFGVNTAQSNLSSLDPDGIHIHNAVWATLFSGGIGGGSTWWWDSYIAPRDLYYHYKAPGLMTANLNFVADDYKPVIVNVTGGGNAEAVISPGFGWGKAPAAAFTIDASGNMTPAASNLGEYVYGSQCKAAEKNPPVFTVNFPIASRFSLRTSDISTYCNAQRVQILVDGTEVLNSPATANTTYSVNIPAGTHTIKVDNAGGDWYRVSTFTFTNIGSPINTYVLRSADAKKATGWVHNKKYNWIDAGPSGTKPPAVTGASLTLTGMLDGSYDVKWYECLNGTVASASTAQSTGGSLVLQIPSLAWDAAFTVSMNVVTSVPEFSPAGGLKIYPNPVAGGKLLIGYELSTRTKMNIDLISMSGTRIANILSASQTAGPQLVEWNVKSARVSAGFYLVRVQSPKGVVIEKVYISSY